VSIQKLYNPVIALLLRSLPHRLMSESATLLTVWGNRSGARFIRPVNHPRDGSSLYILTRAIRAWWRNFSTAARLTVNIVGKILIGNGQAYIEVCKIRERPKVMLKANMNLRRCFGVSLCDDREISGSAKLNQAWR
jgi:hypothetical protein